nr:unnamed protein product [Spirometra erinaceieuropaei]
MLRGFSSNFFFPFSQSLIFNAEVPAAQLPTEKREITEEYLEEWINAGQKALDEDGGAQDEIEELASICNSEAVREELMDPDLMDSVSVREQQISTASLKTQFEKIKELVKKEPTEEQPKVPPPESGDESEEAVPEAERPFLIRRIEGWQYINRIPGERFLYGEIEIGLMYSPERMKLTIEICKGIDIANEQGETLTIWGVLLKKRRIYKKFQSNVSDLANRFGVVGEFKEKHGKARFTTVRQDTHNPVWDEKFEFDLPPNDMASVYVDLEIHEQKSKSSDDLSNPGKTGDSARAMDETVSEASSIANGVKQGYVPALTLFSLAYSTMSTKACSGGHPGISITYRTDGQLLNSRRIQVPTCLFTATV